MEIWDTHTQSHTECETPHSIYQRIARKIKGTGCTGIDYKLFPNVCNDWMCCVEQYHELASKNPDVQLPRHAVDFQRRRGCAYNSEGKKLEQEKEDDLHAFSKLKYCFKIFTFFCECCCCYLLKGMDSTMNFKYESK